MTERLASDQEVVSANWFAEPFKGRTNSSRLLGVFRGEVQNLKRTGQEGVGFTKYIEVFSSP